jgi:hypothetical protein
VATEAPSIATDPQSTKSRMKSPDLERASTMWAIAHLTGLF